MATGNNMNNLTTLIKRLEAATCRLEDMVTTTIVPTPKDTSGLAATTPGRTPASSAPAPEASKPEEPVPKSIEDFDAFLNTTVKEFVNKSNEIGGVVADQAAHVAKVFQNERRFLVISTKSKKPDSAGSDYMALLEPLQAEIKAITDLKDSNRGSPMANQLSAVAESIGVVAWVTIDNKPYKHVEESMGSAQYFGNRVLKEFKDKDLKQAQWVQSYYQIFKDLAEYVKNTFPQGLTWNAKGTSPREAINATEPNAGAPAAPTPPPGGPSPPPPPPPGPPPQFEVNEASPTQTDSGAGAVFSELNKGEDVTKGLKKVSAAEMTHKNPSLRTNSTVPERNGSTSSTSSATLNKHLAPRKTPKPEALRTKKPPKKQLEGSKWIIEHYDNETEPIEIEASISQSILISKCSKTTIRIIGKANAISIDNSPRLSLVIDSLVSSVDVIKSSNFAMQVLGTLPTVLLDQVDGAQLYLGKDSMNTELFTSKCSSINLNIIEGEDEDYKEVALPEQIRTYINKDGKLVSEIVEHAG